ncbi:MAG: DUF1624 domain-containing protein [Lachnospiraceae bacterium]|nr:DUF1624 domain-containing protein [Lachnospiraceae bacterium]
MESKRYEWPDNIRGFTLISMIFYHAVWDIVYLFDVEWTWFQSGLAYLWQQSICWTFIFLSGFCWSFGRNKMRRGIIVFLAGMVVSLVTVIAMPGSLILFGVLTFLGTAMLVMILLEPLCRKGKPLIGFAVSLLLFLLLRNINDGNLGFEAAEVMAVPKELYANDVSTFLGFPKKGFFSTDYFSFFPWFFLFQAGYFGYRIAKEREWLRFLKGSQIPVLGTVGKHSLVVYLIHQPVVYGVLYVFFYFV